MIKMREERHDKDLVTSMIKTEGADVIKTEGTSLIKTEGTKIIKIAVSYRRCFTKAPKKSGKKL